MKIHSLEKIKKLKNLRKKGHSINELVKEFSIPKTTVWHHVHNIKIPIKYQKILSSKQGGSQKRKQENLKKAEEQALQLLRGTDRESAIALAMLYWAEGSKRACEFINSDGRMIKLYLTILRKVFNIQEEELRPTMRFFSGMNRRACLQYWSSVTKIPKSKFIVRFNDGGKNCKTKYGMCRITIKRGANLLKLFNSLITEFSQQVIIS